MKFMKSKKISKEKEDNIANSLAGFILAIIVIAPYIYFGLKVKSLKKNLSEQISEGLQNVSQSVGTYSECKTVGDRFECELKSLSSSYSETIRKVDALLEYLNLQLVRVSSQSATMLVPKSTSTPDHEICSGRYCVEPLLSQKQL